MSLVGWSTREMEGRKDRKPDWPARPELDGIGEIRKGEEVQIISAFIDMWMVAEFSTEWPEVKR